VPECMAQVGARLLVSFLFSPLEQVTMRHCLILICLNVMIQI
jgi:hypothetical protein